MNTDELSGRLYVLEHLVSDLLAQHLKQFPAEEKAQEKFVARITKAIQVGGGGMTGAATRAALETLHRVATPGVMNSMQPPPGKD